jgi:hypothetical protein
MKIYKFKDLTYETKHYEFYQIVLDNCIWCAKPDSLNDPGEFKFKLDCRPSSNTKSLLSQLVEKNGTLKNFPPEISVSFVLESNRLEIIVAPIIENLINECRNSIGIASFSATNNDDHLWNEYGGNGNGVCIEIDIPGEFINKLYHPVHYVSEKVFDIDYFL